MTVRAVGVVVPARDEELLLPACLDALAVALARLQVPFRVVVVLDSCVDDTAAVVGSYPWVSALPVAAGNVGAARRAGAASVLAGLAGVDAEQIWLATTDADSVVPPDWLTGQLALADAGYDVVVGTVAVADWAGHPPEVARRWAAGYRPVEEHRHVHGANLGATAAAYLEAGGFAPLAADEDVALIASLAHRRIARTARLPVVTSARRDARATGGFGDTLRALAPG